MTALFSVVSTAAWALSEVNGVYQIGTAEDLVAFAELVNGGNPYACAVLTADIVKPSTDVSMIGRDGLDFQGTFDGQGHTITIDLYSQGKQGTALFRNVGVHAIVQNLKVQGTITSDQKLAAGVAVWCSGIIRGCYVDVTVNSSFAGDATHGGVVAIGNRGLLIENCLSKFKIVGATTQNCGGLVGWLDNPMNAVNNLVISDGSTLDLTNNGSANIARNTGNMRTFDLATYNENPYANRPAGANFNNYVTNQWGTNNGTTVVSYDDLADGRICYQLNTDQSKINWVQRISTDPFPVPAAFGSVAEGRVYADGPTDCDGKSELALNFSNAEPAGAGVAATPHQFDKYGICTSCGCFNFDAFDFDDPTKYDPTDRTVLLNSADDIYLCEGWNRVGDGFKLNMKMANDIEVISDPGQLIFNDANWVDGNFNGQGNQLTIEMADITVNNASFIPKMTGIFENVIMHGSISTSGQFAASVTSHTYSDNVIIRNVFSDIDFNLTHDGDNTSAGIIGVSESKTKVENVIYAGNINGVEGGNTMCLAAFCGWAAGQTYFTNCAFVGTLNNAVGDSRNVSRNPGNVTSENVWFIEDFGFSDTDKFKVFDGGEEGVESGQLAYYLNGMQGGVERFYQKIGEDMFPMPIKKDGALVYAVSANYQCDGTPLGSDVIYSNNPSGGGVIPPHDFDEGFCTVCGNIQEDYLTPVDGWYEISNGAELLWWSHYAAKHLDASAKLTADIDMDGYSERWASVGTEGAPFYGNFDGQFHIISNLNVDMPEANGVGLIGVMNSLPSKGFGGISDADARAAEGVYIKDVVLDETCSLLGRGYIGLVGMTAPWAGHVKIKGVMMCGDVTANGGPNASGVFGCVMSSACHVTIDSCGMVGNVYGPKENGSFSGWLGSYAEVTNCFAVGAVEGTESDNRYFARYDGNSNVGNNIINCYARYGTQVPIVTEEDFESGALAWRANGNQFRTGYWYQNLGEDMYPYPDPSHGTIIFAADQYFSVATEADLQDVADAIQSQEGLAIEGIIATQSVIDDYKEKLEALSDAATILEFADAVDAVNAGKTELEKNATVYKAYIAKCEEVKRALEAEGSPQGSIRDALEEYLTEVDGPSDDNPLGTYEYIIDEHVATAEEIEKETKRVEEWLAAAVAEDYKAGADVSKLIPNYDFSQEKKNWTGAWSTGYSLDKIKNEDGQFVTGVEAWNVTGDQYQTVEGMKPGYYLVGINGAFRPSNNRYSTNYAAGIYANGNFNYFPTVIEDYVAVNDTVDGVNCNLHVKSALDLAIYDDFVSTDDTNGAELIGYAVHGETGMACAANAGRYQAYTIAKVGEDGKLTIGIKNPGTHYSSDWTGWGALKVTYCADDEAKTGEALDVVLDNMKDRATTIIDYEYDYLEENSNPAAAPNFPEALRTELQAAVGKIDEVSSIEEKEALVAEFSDIFQRVYEGKQAYIELFNTATSLMWLVEEYLPLLEKDEETGEWIENLDETLISEDEYAAIYDAYNSMFEAYRGSEDIVQGGTYSTEEALAAVQKAYQDFAGILPQKDDEGYLLIGTVKEFVGFRAVASYADNTVKAKLTDDIDMYGVGMQPIGSNSFRFGGVFDGQGHAIKNLYINHDEQQTGLFGSIENGTVKNLKVSGEYHSSQKYIGGITGYTRGNSVIDNCDVAVNIYSTVEGDGTHGGLIGVNETAGTVVSNCLVNCPMFGESTNSCGGVAGWATNAFTVKNTLILSTGGTIGTGSCNTVSRNPDNCTVSNVFYVTQFGDANGTKVTAEQLASGEIAYKLNGSQSETPVWYQTIGIDTIPHLFGGDVVFYYGRQYINDKPNPQLNAYAYNLKATKVGKNVSVRFDLNAEAEAANVTFYDGETPVFTKAAGTELAAGTHSVTVSADDLGGNDPMALNFKIEVTGKGSLDALPVGDVYKVWGPYGMAVNNNPESKNFGQVLIAESYPIGSTDSKYISAEKNGAIFAFDQNFKPINAADGTPGFYGDVPFAAEEPIVIAGSYKYDFKDLRFTEDGRLFVARASGKTNSSVWEINPDDLDEPWKPVFTGGELDEATGITYVGEDEQNRPALSLAFEGKGDDLKMYVLGGQRSNGENNTTDYNCSIYNLGTATEWSTAPSADFEPLNGVYTYSPYYVGIHEDGQGGLWYLQDVSSPSEENPVLKHFNAAGNEDYSNIGRRLYGARMATTPDGEYFAMANGSGQIVIYQNTYVLGGNGKLILTPTQTVSVRETSISSLAFDWANNLYVASAGSETFSRYTVPGMNKVVVTPGNGVTPAVADVNADGTTDIADAVAVLNAMAGKPQGGDADVNGDGSVDIADAVAVLSIMAGN